MDYFSVAASPSSMGWPHSAMRQALEHVLHTLALHGIQRTPAVVIMAEAVHRLPNTVQGWLSKGSSRNMPQWHIVDHLRYQAGIASPGTILATTPLPGARIASSTYGWSNAKIRVAICEVVDRLQASGLARSEALAKLASVTGRGVNTIQGWVSEGETRPMPEWTLVDCLRYRTSIALPPSIVAGKAPQATISVSRMPAASARQGAPGSVARLSSGRTGPARSAKPR